MISIKKTAWKPKKNVMKNNLTENEKIIFQETLDLTLTMAFLPKINSKNERKTV